MSEEGKSLYEILGVEKDASQADIKKAYMKLALKLHPDKNPGDEEANSKFQALQRIYAVLKDPNRRKAYDQTGSLEDTEALSGEQFDSLYDYYRNIFKKVTEEDLDQLEAEYRGSEEEKQDVLKYYQQVNGDMEKAFMFIMYSDPKKDSHRFMDLIEEAVSRGDARKFKAFTAWAKEVKQKPRPKNPLAKRKRKSKGSDSKENALVAAIRNKSKTPFDSMLSAMESKYGMNKSAEPSEEEFEKAAKKLKKNRADKAPTKSGAKKPKKKAQ